MAGKTSLLNTVRHGKYSPTAPPKAKEKKDDSDDFGFMYGTPGTDDENHSLSINVDGKQRNLTVLDGGRASTGGRMDGTYFTIPQQFTGANAIVICFDASEKQALRRSFRLLQMAQRDAGICKTPVFLVGLKADKRASLSFEAAQQEANEHLCDSYYECSAKTGEGVTELFSAIVHELDAIKEKDGSVPKISSTEERREAYRMQRETPIIVDDDEITSEIVKTAEAPRPVEAKKGGKTLHKVKGGARPAKQASPCIIQ